jgi:DnaJ-class molecular chaperone
VKTLEGEVEMQVPAGTQSGELLRLRGRGLPGNGKRGDQLVRVVVEIPRKLSSKQRQLLEEFEKEGKKGFFGKLF